MFKRLSLAFALVALTVGVAYFVKPVPAAEAQGTPTNTGYGTITQYMTEWHQNQVIISTSATAINPGSCGYPAGYGYETDPNNAQLQESTLLAAFLGGKQVSLDLQGCTGGTSGSGSGAVANRPMIVGIHVNP